MSSAKCEFDKFSGENDFTLWRIKMKALMVHQGIAAALDATALSTIEDDGARAEMQSKAHSVLILSLGDEVLREVSDESTALAIWEKLEQIYMKKSLANRLYLKKKLYTLQMESGKEIRKHMDEYNKILLDLNAVGVKIDEEDQAIILLSSLPKSYEHIVDTMLYGKETLTMTEVKSVLNSKEIQKKSEFKNEGNSEVLFTQRGRSDKKEFAKRNNSKNRSKSKGPSQRKCWHCKKEGHIRKFCPDRKKYNSDRKSEFGDASVASEGYDSADVLTVSECKGREDWVLDSGATFHMCPSKDLFEELTEAEGGKVVLGNDGVCTIKGTGSIRFKLSSGEERLLTSVCYVPDLRRNLISVGMLDDLGYDIKASQGRIKILKGSLVMLKGIKKNEIYILEGKVIVGYASVAVNDMTRLWHSRLGHISERGLNEMNKQGLFGKDTTKKLEFCENCVLGKSKRVKFESAVHNTNEVLEYIHSDLWGPSRVETLGGARYFLSIIDDCSRKVWIYLLKTKDEVFKTFKTWKTLVELQSGKKVKKLRTDNGLEFVSNEFNTFCREHGIARHKTVRLTPQQNGLAERMNRTLLERVRCMLLGAGVAKQFWGEAVTTACYLINRSPSSAIKFKCPQEIWSGTKPDLKNLRVFGCAAYAHIKQDKLQARALKCIFLGYPTGVKGYRLWCIEPNERRMVISRDVTFNELEMPLKMNQPLNSLSKGDSKVEVELRQEEKINQQPEDEEETENQNSDQSSDNDYQLVRDREKRTVKPTQRYGYADLIAYALSAECTSEPDTFEEAIHCKERDKWLKAM
ncbi:hypothetical protein CASFOL_032473 [Castilleja foliolosa]|uniref:Retrovirus-related Pol polyprotein from transposon TNT 1-94 n=1 Tax=Castilleja foliolosa TaxID=1961234 RepID=A0ABD3C4B6_9LAMI